jgi:23S rRNA (uridine2552-2'-O)-methyltransferase
MKKHGDHYARKARAESYPARSVYKLMDMDRRYRLVRRNMRVLDAGCHPGSWSLYVLKKIGTGEVVGVDRRETRIHDPRFSFVPGDLGAIDPAVLGVFDLVLSDAAPDTTGDKFSDAQSSLRLVARVFEIAAACLKQGGTMVAKLFQGEDSAAFIRSLAAPGTPDAGTGETTPYREAFTCKPAGSRKESREVYVVARGKRAGPPGGRHIGGQRPGGGRMP